MNNNEYLLPRYKQIKNLLWQKIKNGEWEENAQIPSEREISAKYEVSRMTARKALIELVDEGLAYRKVGKGTFVSGQKIERDMVNLSGFSSMLKDKGIVKTTTKLVKAKVIEANQSIAQNLKQSIGSHVYEIIRVRSGKGQPMALEYSYLPTDILPNLLEYDFQTISLFMTIEEKYEIELVEAEQHLELGNVKKEQADLLEIREEQAVFIMSSITYDVYGKPIEYCISYTRGDSCKFVNILRKNKKS